MLFHQLIQTSSRYFSLLKRLCRTQTLTSTESHISHSYGSSKCLSAALQKRQILAILQHNNNNNNFKIFLVSVQMRFLHDPHANAQQFISIGSYSHEVGAFGTLVTSTKVFRLIICKTLWPRPQNDPLPRYLRLRT